MSFELVYTSVPRGLSGASGFCTVAATDGIPRLLHQKMESLSGYNHISAGVGESPINHSHVIVRIQRTMYHILSRVADAGIDYSNRTNKIAHHLALSANELGAFPYGPASLFNDHAFWYTEWDGDPETLPDYRVPTVHGNAASDFDTWGAVFGDPGWAGLLGQAVADGNKPVTVIVPPSEDTTQLLVEAIQLVKPSSRWKVGFSTYFSRLAPGATCQWRFVLDGTSEASKLRVRSPGLLVDPLSASKTLPDGNVFVEAAREGRPESVHNSGSAGRGRTSVARSSSSGGGGGGGGGGGARRRRTSTQRRPAATRRSPARRSPSSRPQRRVVEDVEGRGDDRLPSRTGRGGKPGVAVWTVLGLFLAVVGLLVYYGIQQLL